MIVDQLSRWENYFKNPVWKTIFGELSALNENTPEMEKKIRGDDIILKVFSYATLDPRDEQVYPESHRIYLDIHASIINAERIDWYPASSLTVSRPYDAVKDEITYAKPQGAAASLIMPPGLFVLFGPHDAHMPRLFASGKPQPVKKAVMKIPVDILF
jgi:YhcH/YjgK/YiaL family protein